MQTATVERRIPSSHLRPFLLGPIEGWAQTDGAATQLREVPFPGVPLILGLETAWELDGPTGPATEASFVAGLTPHRRSFARRRLRGRASSCG